MAIFDPFAYLGVPPTKPIDFLKATTGISWTMRTWNPFAGCEIVSAGCKNCYAMQQARRLEIKFGFPTYQGTTTEVNGKAVWTGVVNRASDAKMQEPLRLREPTIWFVNSMSDFWHANAQDRWRHEALEIMRATPQHTYQILTKRIEHVLEIMHRMGIKRLPDNVWMGATLEDHRVRGRAAQLAKVPARIRFLSVEPITARVGPLELDGIDQIITGGESGPGLRHNKPEWTREVRDQCVPRGVAYFHKQWGSFASNPFVVEQGMTHAEARKLDPEDNGKGGALLDGRLWREFPERPPGIREAA